MSTEELLEQALEFYDRLYFIALSKLRNEADAEDITQETIARAAHHAESFQGNSSLFTWLVSILLNLCNDFYRQKKGNHIPEEKAFFVADARVNFEKKVEQNDLFERLNNMIMELDEKYRDIIILRFFQEMSYREISEATGIPEGTVKSRLNEAKHQLFSKLKEIGVKGEDIAM
ncbi:MAG: RNA polymerase sigma factor [Candidatus Hydrogenedentota bacterium]|nr:MAG: RNA polymerase sigma factor [Candidatus Hydrogenedentota bacterium]